MRTLVVLVLAVVASLVTASAAPAASAGSAGFLAAEHPYDDYWGGPSSDQQLTSIGYTICNFRARGNSDLQVLSMMLGGDSMMSPPGSEARERGLQRVRNAVRYLCP